MKKTFLFLCLGIMCQVMVAQKTAPQLWGVSIFNTTDKATSFIVNFKDSVEFPVAMDYFIIDSSGQYSYVFSSKAEADSIADNGGFTIPDLRPVTHYELGFNFTNNLGSVLNYGPIGFTTDSTVVSGIAGVQNSTTRVYPNPFLSDLRITTDEPGRGMMLDVNGREVQEFLLEPGTNTLDTGSYTSGVYYIRIPEGKVQRVVRLVKN